MLINNLTFKEYEGVKTTDTLNWLPTKEELEVLEKNKFTCFCCSLVSAPNESVPSGYLEIKTINKKKRLLCSFCMQSQHLSRRINGGNLRHGYLVYAPEVSQGQLSKLALWTYFYERFSPSQGAKAALLESELIDMADSLEAVFTGLGSNKQGNVELYLRMESGFSPEIKKKKAELIKGIRYLPKKETFSRQVNHWAEVYFKKNGKLLQEDFAKLVSRL